MTLNKSPLPFCGLLAALLLGLPSLAVAKPTITLESQKIFLGEPTTVVVTTKGSNADQPELSTSEGLSPRFVDKQPRQLEDGSAALAWRFLVIARRAGAHQLQVPYGDLNAEEIFYVTETLEAVEPKASDEMTLAVSLSAKSCYVGQPVILSASWELWLPVQNVRAVDLRLPLLESPDFRVLTPYGEDAGGSQTIGVPVSGSRVIAERRSLRKGDKRLTLITFERIIVPQKSGNFDVDPATLLCSVHQGAASRFQYPSYFNNDFFLSDEDGKHVRVWSKSKALKLQVEALPPNPPEDFTGIVGTCEIELAAAVKEVDAGEPVLLRIRASGYPVMEVFELPMLSRLPAFANRFDCPTRYLSGTLDDGAKVFERIIRPQRPEVSEIPAVRFSVFNPTTAEYEKIVSNALPLQVNPARTFTAFDADFADGRTLKNQVETNARGISHNVFGTAVLAKRAPVTSPDLMPFIWLILCLPPLLFAGGLLVNSAWYADLTDPRRRRARRALAEVEAAAAGSDALTLAQAVRNFAAARFELLPNAHSVAELAQHADLPVDALQAIADLYALEAAARYGDGNAGSCDVAAVLACVRQVSHQPWRRSGAVDSTLLALLVLGLLAAPANLRADTPEETLATAEATFNAALAAAMEDSAEGRELYRQAALHYERLVADHDARNAIVYVNLGNAWYLADEPGLAIVNYLRAERFQPDNPLIQQNLAHVRSEVSDTFQRTAWQQLSHQIQGWAAWLPAWFRILLLAAAYAMAWRLVWLWVRRGKRYPRAIATLAVLSLILLTTLTAGQSNAARGVVVVAEVMPRKGNSFVYEGAFTTALHAGTEFTVLETRNDWLHAEFPNGNRAWLPAPAIQLVTE